MKIKEKVKNILGEGKLYEIELYGGKISSINTNQKNFNRLNGNFDEWHVSCFDEVTNRDDSKIIGKIKDIFNCEVKILAICDYYTSNSEENEIILKRKNELLAVRDVDCTYIVCTVNKKTKLKNFNITEDDNIEISDFDNRYEIC